MGTIATMNVALKMDSSDFDQSIGRVVSKTEGLTSKLGNIGRNMSLAVTAPLVGIGAAALKTAGDFEQNMNILQSVSDATAGDMAALSSQALQLGADTAFSAGEAAEAMLELGKAGLDTNAIMGATPGVLSLAAAGNLSVGAAATIAANAVNTFGLEASETTTVANMLAAAANASSSSVEDLSAGFANAGSIFASNGQSMSSLATSISIMSNAGIAGAEAGTQLKSMMLALTGPSTEAAAVMADLGIAVYDASGEMKPFEEIVGSLEKATTGMSDAQRQAAMSTIFGNYAINAATILTAAGAEGFAAMETQVTAAGAAQEAAAARMGGFNGAMESLQGSVDSLLITLGSQFLDDISALVKWLTEMVNNFAALDPQLQTAIVAFAGIAAVMGPILMILPGLVAGFTAMGVILGAIGAPVYLVIAAVAALAAAWTTDFGGIRTKTLEVWAAIQPSLQEAANWLSVNIPAALTALKTAWDTTWNGLTAVVTTVQTKWTEFSTAVTNLLTGETTFSITLPVWITEILDWTWPELASRAVEWLATLLKWAWPVFPDAVAWLLELFDWGWPDLPANPVQWLLDLFDFDWPKFPALPKWIDDLMHWSWPAPELPDVGANVGAAVDSFGAWFGGADGDPLTPMATGGPVTSSGAYLIGERGPELFIPNRSGTIIPNDELGGMWGSASADGSGVQINNYGDFVSPIDLQALAFQVAQFQARRR